MILIVDDDQDIASRIKFNLDRANLYASSFTDPLMALKEFRSCSINYDLVISDVRMPHMNGYELVEQLKKIKPDVKILLMSAFEYDSDYGDLYFKKGLSRSDIDGFIEKPISLNSLRIIVLNTLDNKLHVPTNLDLR